MSDNEFIPDVSGFTDGQAFSSSVSGGDTVYVFTVSSGDAYDDSAILDAIQALRDDFTGYAAALLQEEAEEETRTLFNAQLTDFTVEEGLLLLVFLVLFATLVRNIFGGNVWHK